MARQHEINPCHGSTPCSIEIGDQVFEGGYILREIPNRRGGVPGYEGELCLPAAALDPLAGADGGAVIVNGGRHRIVAEAFYAVDLDGYSRRPFRGWTTG